MFKFKWVFPKQLARSPRPRIKGKTGPVPKPVVDAWLKGVRKEGFRSIICLLEDRELRKYYGDLPVNLISHYKSKGLNVAHIEVLNLRRALSHENRQEIWKAYRSLEKPILIHCSAGRMRTGKAVKSIKSRLSQETPGLVRYLSQEKRGLVQ